MTLPGIELGLPSTNCLSYVMAHEVKSRTSNQCDSPRPSTKTYNLQLERNPQKFVRKKMECSESCRLASRARKYVAYYFSISQPVVSRPTSVRGFIIMLTESSYWCITFSLQEPKKFNFIIIEIFAFISLVFNKESVLNTFLLPLFLSSSLPLSFLRR
jgi:hypothetical protein